MPEPLVRAVGDRAAAVLGSDNVVFTGDVYAGARESREDLLLLARAIDRARPRCERRPAPTTRPPAPFVDRVNRDTAVAKLADAVSAGGYINLHGEEGVGKTYVVRASLEGSQAPDGVVWIEGGRRKAGDVLQGIFETLFEAHPMIATPEQRRSLFGDIRALVVIEDALPAREDADQIRTELPNCTVVLVTRGRAEWSGPIFDTQLDGLHERDALGILVRSGAPITERDLPAARRLIELMRGNPRRLRQAAWAGNRLRLQFATLVSALEVGPDDELRGLLLEALGPEDRAILDVLAGACRATLAADRLQAITGLADAPERLKTMDDADVVKSGSPRYRLAGALVGYEVAGSQERLAKHLTKFATEHRGDIRPLLDELPAATALLTWAQQHDRPDLTVALGRAFAPPALFGRQWETWSDMLRSVYDGARQLGDTLATAWALHHLGTRAYLSGERDTAVAQLREALKLRQRISDREGAAATENNLEFILGPSTPPPDPDDSPLPGGRGPRGRLIALTATVLVALGVGAAALAGNDPPADSLQPTPTPRRQAPPSTQPDDTISDSRTEGETVAVPPTKGETVVTAREIVEDAKLKFEPSGACAAAPTDTCRAVDMTPPSKSRVRVGREVIVVFDEEETPTDTDTDTDTDRVPDAKDNCLAVSNANQDDLDGDGLRDECDNDDDNDGTLDEDELPPPNSDLLRAPEQGLQPSPSSTETGSPPASGTP